MKKKEEEGERRRKQASARVEILPARCEIRCQEETARARSRDIQYRLGLGLPFGVEWTGLPSCPLVASPARYSWFMVMLFAFTFASPRSKLKVEVSNSKLYNNLQACG